MKCSFNIEQLSRIIHVGKRIWLSLTTKEQETFVARGGTYKFVEYVMSLLSIPRTPEMSEKEFEFVHDLITKSSHDLHRSIMTNIWQVRDMLDENANDSFSRGLFMFFDHMCDADTNKITTKYGDLEVYVTPHNADFIDTTTGELLITFMIH